MVQQRTKIATGLSTKRKRCKRFEICRFIILELPGIIYPNSTGTERQAPLLKHTGIGSAVRTKFRVSSPAFLPLIFLLNPLTPKCMYEETWTL